jgi:hypothetical protein
MKTNLNKELFTETGCIDRSMLLNYRDGMLKRSDMHLVERHLVDCALCSEALEGLSTLQDDSVLTELSQHFNPQTGKSTNQSSPFRYLAMAASLTAVIEKCSRSRTSAELLPCPNLSRRFNCSIRTGKRAQKRVVCNPSGFFREHSSKRV